MDRPLTLVILDNSNIMFRIILMKQQYLLSFQDIPSNNELWQCTMQITDGGCHNHDRDEIIRRILEEISRWSLDFTNRVSERDEWFNGVDCVELSVSSSY